jgi:hypothetical protein
MIILLIKLAPTLLFNNIFDKMISITILKGKKKKKKTLKFGYKRYHDLRRRLGEFETLSHL